ncbi:unnamed protein product [Rhizophagus irregularis]|nr:hypothetical protein RhiirC2_780280 [Rhizophagus irregularis]CAB4391254.1 unnamed protein product [Rhizophagus irregularis]CAB5371688.1 unnamed protein product [Rhizophagus irregularis]
MFILQWIPMLISQGARFVLNEEPWVYVMGTIGRSFGGIGNLIQFILNEGFFPKSYDINYDNENSGISLENTKPKINSRDDKIIIINENSD